MNINTLSAQRHQPGSSLLHHLDSRVKVVTSFLLIVGVVITPDYAWVAYPLLWTLVGSLAAISQLSVWRLGRLAGLALPFTLAAVTLLVTTPGQPVMSAAGLIVTDTGMGKFLGIVFKSWLSMQIALLLSLTTSSTDLLWALKGLGISETLVATISLMQRYLLTLKDEAERLLRARAARSGARENIKPGGHLLWRARVAGGMVGNLFLRSYERSERVYAAMLARGYNGHVRISGYAASDLAGNCNRCCSSYRGDYHSDCSPTVMEISKAESHIAVNHLRFHYPDGQPALQDISFSIAPSEKVALVGANGSGKSTLLLHLNGILRAVSGSISICDVPLTEKTIPQIRAWVGLLFQNPDDQLFSPRVYDDVAFAARYMGLSETEVKERVTQALSLVGMDTYADRIPYHLSIGEKKRIVLATVLAMDTRILALDEPSAGLDPRARRELIQLLKTFSQQTIISSTHDMRLAAALCTHAIVLDAGEVVASGTVETILYNRELMERHGLETPE